ncbi:MAG: class I SAM-dependent methyltransferase [Acidobacteriota bacterium]
MNPGVLEDISRLEAHHWWYRGLRGAIAGILDRLELADRPAVLDAGCGTGMNLLRLRELLAPRHLEGFDLDPAAVAFAREKLGGDAHLYRDDITAPSRTGPPLDLVVSCDVLNIMGLEGARGGLEALVDRLSPNGLLVLNLPALEWLRGPHDDAVHGTRRFALSEVERFLNSLGLSVERASYRLLPLLPALAAYRLAARWRPRPTADRARSDLEQGFGGPTHAILSAILAGENALLSRGVRMPLGSSITVAARKPAGPQFPLRPSEEFP